MQPFTNYQLTAAVYKLPINYSRSNAAVYKLHINYSHSNAAVY